MSLAEFDLIRRFFTAKAYVNSSIRLGVGDDCALLSVPAGFELAVTVDTMVQGVHFLPGTDPKSLGHKLLAVNLSDLAAMGAEPVAVLLALTLPEIDEVWLEQFSAGFMALAERYSVDLIGGDTTSGPLTLTVQAMGWVPEGQGFLRSTACIGDAIFMTGRLGDAGLGLKIEQGYRCSNPQAALNRFHRPEPRIKEGLALRQIAGSCIDVSDGLAQDLGHILRQSGVGACIDWDALPLSDEVKAYIAATGDWAFPLKSGDDYELCFTVPPNKVGLLRGGYARIGVIEGEAGLRIKRDGATERSALKGYEHFS